MDATDLSALSNHSIQTELNKIITDHLKVNQFDTKISLATNAGDNYTGTIYRIACRKLSIEKDSDDPQSEFKIIVKIAPQHQERRELAGIRPLYLCENFAFNEIIPAFCQLEHTADIHGKNGFHEYPTCYKTIDAAPYECVFMADLCAEGFTMFDSAKSPISAEHVFLVMKVLGKFHAISFAMKTRQPEKFEKFTSKLLDIEYEFRPKVTSWSQIYVKFFIAFAKKFASEDIAKRVAQLFAGSLSDLFDECRDSAYAEPFAVICHGDCWENNTMIKTDENGVPTEIRILDFQKLIYASPVLDLLDFIYRCTDKDLRDRHYDEFIKAYYSSCCQHLQRFGLDAEKIYPYSALLGELQRIGKYGLVISFLHQIFWAIMAGFHDFNEMFENGSDSENIMESLNRLQLNDALKKRLLDVLTDVAQRNYI